MDNDRRTLPEGWEWCEILDVAAKTKYPIGDGDHGQIKPSMYTNSGIPYIRVADISKGEIKKEKLVYISKEIHEKNLKSELHPDDIIISKTGATIGKVAIIPDEIHLANTTSSVGKITLDHNKMIPKFLFYFMNTKFFQNQMWSVSFKSAQPGFNIIDLKKFKILVPPLPTQRRIVSILEKAEETKRLRAQADELTDRLLQSVFLEMFGDPVKNTKGWEVVKFGNLWSHYSHGYAGRNNLGNPSGTLILRIRNVLKDRIVYEKLDREEVASEYVPKYALEKGNLLMVRVNGSPEEIGRSVIFNGFNEVVIHDDNIIRIVLDSASVLPEYIQSLLKSRYVRSKIAKTCKSTAGQYLLSKTKLFEIDVPCPSLHLQQEFARIVEKVESMRQSQKQSKQQIEDLFSTLMQKAFKGELVA